MVSRVIRSYLLALVGALVTRLQSPEPDTLVSAIPLNSPRQEPLQYETQCQNNHSECESWAGQGECNKNPGYMAVMCRAACNACPTKAEAKELKRKTCVDERSECQDWALRGECGTNPKYMLWGCPRACNSCHMLVKSIRCRYFSQGHAFTMPPFLKATFERALVKYSHLKPKVLSRSPWVVTFDEFATDNETAGVVEAATSEGFSRSTLRSNWLAALGIKRHGAHKARTSETAWCSSHECIHHPAVQTLTNRIADLAGQLPVANQEFLQVLRYNPGGYYRNHSDFIDEHLKGPIGQAIGPRLLTVYIYLNDPNNSTKYGEPNMALHDATSGFLGGETHFTELNLTVTPKRGRAIMWPSVLEVQHAPIEINGELYSTHGEWQKDTRTHHEAREVTSGTKYGANAWVHASNFRDYSDQGCDTSF